jgi:flap endonuclease-1
VIEHETKYPPRVSPDAYLEQVQSARHVFETLPPLPELEHFEPTEIDETLIMETLLRCGLQRAAVDDWDFGAALAGNYFEDDLSVSVLQA